MTDNLLAQLEDIFWVDLVKKYWDHLPADAFDKLDADSKKLAIENAKVLHSKVYDNSVVEENQDKVWEVMSSIKDESFNMRHPLTSSSSSPWVCVGRCSNRARVFFRLVAHKYDDISGMRVFNAGPPMLVIRSLLMHFEEKLGKFACLNIDPPIPPEALCEMLENSDLIVEGRPGRVVLRDDIINIYNTYVKNLGTDDKKWWR